MKTYLFISVSLLIALNAAACGKSTGGLNASSAAAGLSPQLASALNPLIDSLSDAANQPLIAEYAKRASQAKMGDLATLYKSLGVSIPSNHLRDLGTIDGSLGGMIGVWGLAGFDARTEMRHMTKEKFATAYSNLTDGRHNLNDAHNFEEYQARMKDAAIVISTGTVLSYALADIKDAQSKAQLNLQIASAARAVWQVGAAALESAASRLTSLRTAVTTATTAVANFPGNAQAVVTETAAGAASAAVRAAMPGVEEAATRIVNIAGQKMNLIVGIVGGAVYATVVTPVAIHEGGESQRAAINAKKGSL